MGVQICLDGLYSMRNMLKVYTKAAGVAIQVMVEDIAKVEVYTGASTYGQASPGLPGILEWTDEVSIVKVVHMPYVPCNSGELYS